MKLSAIILARAIGYVETFDLSPRGKVFLPEIVPEIVKEFNFQQFPKSTDELDESKGIEFLEGKFRDKVIQKFAIWNTLLIVETRSNTEDSKTILQEMLVWGADKFGLNYKPGMLKQFAYVSDLTFYSDIPLLSVSPALTNLSSKTSDALSEIWHDPMARKYGIAPFSITRRAEARFSENKYFSEAPLPTDVHIRFLEEFEKDVASATQSTTKQSRM